MVVTYKLDTNLGKREHEEEYAFATVIDLARQRRIQPTRDVGYGTIERIRVSTRVCPPALRPA